MGIRTFDFDYVELYGDAKNSPLRSCSGCHEGPGVTSFMTYAQIFASTRLVSLHPTDEAAEGAVAIKSLESQSTWKRLRELMKDK